jgi:hypothetical protein
MRHLCQFETLEDRRLLSVAVTSIAADSAVAGLPTNTVARSEKMTLTATGVTATALDKITGVTYFIDNNSNGVPDKGDKIIGTTNNANKNYAVKTELKKNVALGSLTISAVARGKGRANFSPVVIDTVTVVDDPPTIKRLVAAPKKVLPSGKLTLIAVGANDKDGTISKVDFWLDVDKNGTIDPLIDTLVGSDTSKAGGFKADATGTTTGKIGGDTLNFLAQATDSDGSVSTPVGAIVTIK